jgi:hypothetical protein
MRAQVVVLILVIALLATATGGLAEESTSLHELLVEYRCPVVDRLERVYEAGDPSSHRDRFVAITVPEHPHGYVQCMFHDRRKRVLCEASSGFFFDPPGTPRSFYLSAAAIASLARLGFSTDDSKGNFQIDFAVGDDPDLNAIADLILKALHDGYGARATTRLRFNAPFAPRPTSRCIPVG